MITLHGDTGKTIQFSIGNAIYEGVNNTYVIEMPVVICSDKKDAKRIQEDISNLVGELSKKLLKE